MRLMDDKNPDKLLAAFYNDFYAKPYLVLAPGKVIEKSDETKFRVGS